MRTFFTQFLEKANGFSNVGVMGIVLDAVVMEVLIYHLVLTILNFFGILISTLCEM